MFLIWTRPYQGIAWVLSTVCMRCQGSRKRLEVYGIAVVWSQPETSRKPKPVRNQSKPYLKLFLKFLKPVWDYIWNQFETSRKTCLRLVWNQAETVSEGRGPASTSSTKSNQSSACHAQRPEALQRVLKRCACHTRQPRRQASSVQRLYRESPSAAPATRDKQVRKRSGERDKKGQVEDKTRQVDEETSW